MRLGIYTADGVYSRRSVYDVFSREVNYLEARGFKWTKEFNRNNLQITVISSLQKVTRNTYNEIKLSLSQTDTTRYTTLFNHDAEGNLTARILANGMQHTMQYGMHHKMLVQTRPNNEGSLSWHYDDYGILVSHRDLANANYHYQYDLKKQLVREYQVIASDSPAHKQKNVITERGGYFPHGGLYDVDIAGKDQYFTYDAGRLHQIRDNALRQITTIHHDSEDRAVQRTVTTFDGALVGSYATVFNAAGYEIKITDSNLEILFSIDANGNRLITTTNIFSNFGSHSHNSICEFDSLNRITRDGEVRYHYSNNYGDQEQRDGRVYNLTYNPDGLLEESKADNKHFVKRVYNSLNMVESITECKGEDVLLHEMQYDPITHAQISSKESKPLKEGLMYDSRFENIDSEGMATTQYTHFRKPVVADDKTDNIYTLFESKQLNAIHTKRTKKGEDPTSSFSINLHNANGHVQSTRNGISREEEPVNYTESHYSQTYNGLPLSVTSRGIQMSNECEFL